MRKNEKSTDRTRRWREKNREKNNQYMRDYRRGNLDQMLADPHEIWFEKDPRKRRLLKQATPVGVDREAIRRVYQKCQELNQRYPSVGFVVHHQIPITHRSVCGLHVPENLKVVSLSLKSKLGRRFVD